MLIPFQCFWVTKLMRSCEGNLRHLWSCKHTSSKGYVWRHSQRNFWRFTYSTTTSWTTVREGLSLYLTASWNKHAKGCLNVAIVIVDRNLLHNHSDMSELAVLTQDLTNAYFASWGTVVQLLTPQPPKQIFIAVVVVKPTDLHTRCNIETKSATAL